MATKKMTLDAGHGLKTPGKQTPTGIKEWTLNDKVADKVEKTDKMKTGGGHRPSVMFRYKKENT